MKVSVVVPVFNVGQRIGGLLDSLSRQTMGVDDREVVLVDDGSSDDTPSVLRLEAARRAHHRVITIAPSGWPGRPRNVGLDHAAGDFVFFADQDDELFPDALRRMHAMAVADDADVVYGKVVRVGAPTPYWPLAHADIHLADLARDHVLESRSVHKLYRREFLVDHDVRFPEGPVRLEDHDFMGQVLARRPRVSVLASYPCYRWIRRDDGTNTSAQRTDLRAYFGYLTASVRWLQAPEVPDAVQLEAAVVTVDRMLLPVRPRVWAAQSERQHKEAFALLRSVVAECVPSEVDPHLAALKVPLVRALRTDDQREFERVQALRTGLRLRPDVERAQRHEDVLQLHVKVTALTGDGLAVGLVDVDGRPQPTTGPLRTLGVELAAWDDLGHVELTARHRTSGVEWPLPGRSWVVRPPDGTGPLRLAADAHLDPRRAAFGDALEPGQWQVLLRAQVLGESRIHEVHAGGTGRLTLNVDPDGSWEQRAVGFWLQSARWRRGRLRLGVASADGAGAAATVVLRRRGATGDQTQSPIIDGHAVVRVPSCRPGDLLDLFVRIDRPSEQREQRLVFGRPQVRGRGPAALYATRYGSASLRYRGAWRPGRRRLRQAMGRRVRRARAKLGW